jgi:hypothetical protein
MVGEIILESWARSNRNTRARSSESANTGGEVVVRRSCPGRGPDSPYGLPYLGGWRERSACPLVGSDGQNFSKRHLHGHRTARDRICPRDAGGQIWWAARANSAVASCKGLESRYRIPRCRNEEASAKNIVNKLKHADNQARRTQRDPQIHHMKQSLTLLCIKIVYSLTHVPLPFRRTADSNYHFRAALSLAHRVTTGRNGDGGRSLFCRFLAAISTYRYALTPDPFPAVQLYPAAFPQFAISPDIDWPT